MIEQSATRFNNGDWFHTRVDTEDNSCVVSGFLNGEPVEFSGGGSSDFSTATVTVVRNSSALEGVFVVAYPEYNFLLADYGATPSGTYTVPLYKGTLILSTNGSGSVSVSGACEYADGQFIITGDCTITIS